LGERTSTEILNRIVLVPNTDRVAGFVAEMVIKTPITVFWFNNLYFICKIHAFQI
jgi:hypothetical protein